MAQLEEQRPRQQPAATLEERPLVPTPMPIGPPLLPSRVDAPCGAPDERAARRALRAQIAKLERDLSDAVADAFPHVPARLPGHARGGPHLLSLGELERQRDRLAQRLAHTRGAISARAEIEERNRVLLERILLEPKRYKFVRLANADLGVGGCGVWEVRPRLGIVGMLAGWWQVKLSSGCPLAGGPRHGARPRLSPAAVGV
jgi:hypothetical protein